MFETLKTLLIMVAIFLICRELVCWYWKMNETVKLLTQIRDSLKVLNLETEIKTSKPKQNQPLKYVIEED